MIAWDEQADVIVVGSCGLPECIVFGRIAGERAASLHPQT